MATVRGPAGHRRWDACVEVRGLEEGGPVRVGRDLERALAILVAECQRAIDPVGPRTLFDEAIACFVDGVEPLDTHLLAEQIPAGMPATLHADIDDHEWFVQQPVFDHPAGEIRPIVMIEIRSIAPRSPISSRPPPEAARQQRTKTTHCPDRRK